MAGSDVWETRRLPQSSEGTMVPPVVEGLMGMSTGDRGNTPCTPPKIPPKFGMDGTVLPGTWSDVQPQWQKMTELPKLNIPKGEAWEK